MNAGNENGKIYDAVNQLVLQAVPANARSILDLGCGSGSLGRELKRRSGGDCRITGVTFSEQEAMLAGQYLDEVIVADLNEFEGKKNGSYDCIICSHVLEHLYWPETLLRRLRAGLTPEGVLVVGLPNILHWKQRAQFLLGRFRYADYGLMDRTHFRFFDWSTAKELIASNGYSIVSAVADGGFPQGGLVRRLNPFAKILDQLALRLAPGIFGWQFVIVSRAGGDLGSA
jgi:SAM-dependent methyltransferase